MLQQSGSNQTFLIQWQPCAENQKNYCSLICLLPLQRNSCLLSATVGLLSLPSTTLKVSKYGVFSGSYFPVFGPEKIMYLDIFHAVFCQCKPTHYLQNFHTGLFRCNGELRLPRFKNSPVLIYRRIRTSRCYFSGKSDSVSELGLPSKIMGFLRNINKYTVDLIKELFRNFFSCFPSRVNSCY